MTIVHSNIKPAEQQIDRIEAGIARLLIRWDIRQVTIPDPVTGETRQEWQYNERVIKWTLPHTYITGTTTITLDSLENVETYLSLIQAEILDWAKATGLSTGGRA